MKMTYKDYEEMGTDLWHLGAEDLFNAAVAYRTEVRRRLRQAKNHKELREVRAYKRLLGESRTTSRELVVTRKRPGENNAQWRNRLALEISRGKRYLNAQTSTWSGYKAWREHVLEAIADATGLKLEEVKRKLRGVKLDKFLKFFEDVKQDGNMLLYLSDSDKTFDIAYNVFIKNDGNKSVDEMLQEVGELINEWYKEQDRKKQKILDPGGGPKYPPAPI